MEEKAKPDTDRHSALWAELQEKAKEDPELAKKLKAEQNVMERYKETFQRLADC